MNIEKDIELLKDFHGGDEKAEQFEIAINNVIAAYKKLKLQDIPLLEGELKVCKGIIEEVKLDLNKKDKIINLMEDYIEKAGTTDDFCQARYNKVTYDCDRNCKLCIRKYFRERCKQ